MLLGSEELIACVGIRLGVVIRENIRCNVGIFMLDNLCLGGEDRGVLDGGVGIVVWLE